MPAEQPARRGRPGHDHDTVLRTAVEEFNRRGYDATSVGDIADALGLSKSAIYHHVPSKAHLLGEALDEALDALTAVLDRAEQQEARSAVERLRYVVRGAVLTLVDRLPEVTLLLRVHGNSPVEQHALQRRRDVDDRFARLVAAAVAEGSVRADLPADLVSRLLFGMVNSVAEWYRPEGDPTALADAVTALAFDGLATPPPAPGRGPTG